MRKIIIQHASPEQEPILDLVKATNKAYADKFKFDYITDTVKRTEDRTFHWEKILLLQKVMNSEKDGSLIVWEDADSLNVGNEDFEDALPPSATFGMVRNLCGLNGMEPSAWYNSGVIVVINNPETRYFLQKAWDRGGRTDEHGLMNQLKMTHWMVGNTAIASIDPKWNCWKNNRHVCLNPVVKTFHGLTLEKKLIGVHAEVELLKLCGS